MVLLGFLMLRHALKDEIRGGIAAMQFYTALVVEIMNAILSALARTLTTQENHRTQTEHDTAQLAKVVCFKFINSYFALYYIAFFKNHAYLFNVQMRCIRGDCLLDLQSQLSIFIGLRIIIAFGYEYIRPRLGYMHRTWYNEGRSLLHALTKGAHLELADMSKAEKQSRDDKFESFGEFDQVLVTHGYATLFAVSSPWVCAATLFACLVNLWLDMRKLLDTKQRPVPRKVRNIEPWDTAFEIYGMFAAATNLFLLIFSSQQYMFWTFTEKLCYFVFLEHYIIFCRIILVNHVFPSVPRSVQLLKLKQESIVHRSLENIKVEAVSDLSMFREHKIDEYEIFEMDYLEDENDAADPSLDLGQSGRTMYNNIKEQVSRSSRPHPNSPVASPGPSRT